MNKETLKSLAHNLLFDMKDEEYETLSKEFDIILKQMKYCGKMVLSQNIRLIKKRTNLMMQ